jgi:putative hydrolase of the HAD superfamily
MSPPNDQDSASVEELTSVTKRQQNVNADAATGNGETLASSPLSDDSDRPPITTLIFDVDDTLYDVGTGFTGHRNGYGAQSFMVETLEFPNLEDAGKMRDKYFARYHSTAKALAMMEEEGQFPDSAPKFQAADLAEWWATNLDFSLLRAKEDGKDEYAELRHLLKSCPLKLVAFSNGPRTYVLRVLQEMGLADVFPEDMVFAVDDVLPACKPEAEAFAKVFAKLNIHDPRECVMVEDSMKNIQAAKKLGMSTVLISGRTSSSTTSTDGKSNGKADAEATKPGDAPDLDDPSVDVAMEHCGELQQKCPGLWSQNKQFTLNP